MRIVSFITEDDVIEKILEHLNLVEEQEEVRGPPGTGPPMEPPDNIAERSAAVLNEIEERIADGSVYAGIAPLFEELAGGPDSVHESAGVASGIGLDESADETTGEYLIPEESENFCDAPGDGEVFDTEREAS